MTRNAHAMAGLTLLELVVTMAVLIVTVTIAIPSFQGVVERTRTASAYHQLTASLMLARSTAVTRREPVVVCPSADGYRCRKDLVWEDGWIVFPDPLRNGQPAGPADVLRRADPIGGGLQVRTSRGRPLVRYLPNGRTSGSNLSLRVCRGEDQLLARVVVNNVGRTRTERTSGSTPC